LTQCCKKYMTTAGLNEKKAVRLQKLRSCSVTKR